MFYQQVENGTIANQIHGFTIDYGKFILIQNMISGLSGNKSVLSLTCAVCVMVTSHGNKSVLSLCYGGVCGEALDISTPCLLSFKTIDCLNVSVILSEDGFPHS